MTRHPENSVLKFPGVTLSDETHRNEDFAWSLSVGYRLTRYVAVEASYLDLGDTAFFVTGDSSTVDSARGSFRSRGAAWSVVGLLPLAKWEPYLRAGIFYSDTELSFAGSIAGTPISAKVDGDTKDALYGIGVGYCLTERVQAKLDLTFVDVGEPETGHSEAAIVSLGVNCKF